MVGGTGQAQFTVGGYFASLNSNPLNPPSTGLPGIFAVEGMNPSVTHEGDSGGIGDFPNIKNETTAIYIASTVVGGDEEDSQFATIKNHSYISIDQIL